MQYSDFRFLTIDRQPNGVALVTLNRPEVMNATNARLHWELTQIWDVVNGDPEVRVVVVTAQASAPSPPAGISTGSPTWRAMRRRYSAR